MDWVFSRTTIATMVMNAGEANSRKPKIMTGWQGVPRVSNRGGGLLIETQGTNLHIWSAEMNSLFDTKVNSSVVTDSVVALNGVTEADTLHEDGTAAVNHYFREFGNVTAGNVYTWSIFVKEINRNWIYLRKSGTLNVVVNFNLATGLVGTTSNDEYATIEKYPDDWYRLSITWDETTTELVGYFIYIAEADNDVTFDGLNQDSYYAWGSQVEVNAFPTSYIPTTTTAETRNADDITMAPTVLPDEFAGGTVKDKLTISMDVKGLWSSSTDIGEIRRILEISGNTGTASETRNRLAIYGHTNGSIYVLLRDDADADHSINTAADAFDYDEWYNIRVVIDFSDLSRMDMFIDDSNAGLTYVGNSGTADFDLADTTIRLGQQYDDTVSGCVRIKNLSIVPSEVFP
jgi:hypothetical protein